jgi:uncharacterized protein YdeI (BOF family)
MRNPVYLLLLTGCLLAACKPQGKILGKAPKARIVTILAIHAGDAPNSVSLRGTLVEKCPVAGCWFKLQDETGLIKVDTRNAGFVVTKIPLNSTLTVGGLVVSNGNEAQVEATGLIF